MFIGAELHDLLDFGKSYWGLSRRMLQSGIAAVCPKFWFLNQWSFANTGIEMNVSVQYVHAESGKEESYDMSQDYFRFMFAEAVEPTNNHSEQQIRHCIIDRRITQGTRGDAGMRYHERMWTIIATCKKQQRSVFSFLHESIVAKRTGTATPSLIG